MGVWDHGTPPGWNAVRAFVLKRDKYKCQYTLRGCREVADQVNHTEGDAADPLDTRFLKAICGPCNKRIGDPTKNKRAGEVELPDFLREALEKMEVDDGESGCADL